MRRLVSLILAIILIIACSGCFWDHGREGYGEQDRGGHDEQNRGGHDEHDHGGYGEHEEGH